MVELMFGLWGVGLLVMLIVLCYYYNHMWNKHKKHSQLLNKSNITSYFDKIFYDILTPNVMTEVYSIAEQCVKDGFASSDGFRKHCVHLVTDSQYYYLNHLKNNNETFNTLDVKEAVRVSVMVKFSHAYDTISYNLCWLQFKMVTILSSIAYIIGFTIFCMNLANRSITF